MKIVRLTLAEEWSSREHSLGRGESSKHSSTNFCTFCLSTATEYSKSCLYILTSTKALLQGVDMAM